MLDFKFLCCCISVMNDDKKLDAYLKWRSVRSQKTCRLFPIQKRINFKELINNCVNNVANHHFWLNGNYSGNQIEISFDMVIFGVKIIEKFGSIIENNSIISLISLLNLCNWNIHIWTLNTSTAGSSLLLTYLHAPAGQEYIFCKSK